LRNLDPKRKRKTKIEFPVSKLISTAEVFNFGLGGAMFPDYLLDSADHA
jgi:hypothetical protein